MKKHILLIIVFASIAINAYSQTDSLEKAILYSKVLSGEKRTEVFSSDALRWRKFTEDIGGYPDMPLDLNGKVHFDFTKQFPGKDKDYLFNRACEWLVINYGIVPSQVYSNREDGKVLYINTLATSSGYDCSFTTIITINGNFIRTEFTGLSYSLFIEGHYSVDEEWVPERTIRYNMDQVVPVILKRQQEWKTYTDMLRASKDLLNKEILNLYDYISLYDSIYVIPDSLNVKKSKQP
ncbi:MAG TPA: hypothetical protein VK213_03760 [Bacteroidales bacterium]|nr:hypothetical protein [Bacteroidales bacterium]